MEQTAWSPLMLLRSRISLFITDSTKTSVLPSSPLLKGTAPQQVQPSDKAAMPARAPGLQCCVWQGPSKMKKPHKKNVTKDLSSQHKLISRQRTRCDLKWSTVPHLDKNYKDKLTDSFVPPRPTQKSIYSDACEFNLQWIKIFWQPESQRLGLKGYKYWPNNHSRQDLRALRFIWEKQFYKRSCKPCSSRPFLYQNLPKSTDAL